MSAAGESSGFPTFRPVADHALLIELGDSIRDDIHARVLALDAALSRSPPPGLIETVPAYASLLIEFDPLIADHEAVRAAASALLDTAATAAIAAQTREILVCYDIDLAPDLAEVAARCGRSVEEVIAAHCGADYRVYMYGFAPGYAYLAGVPPELQLPRKAAAVRNVPAGSVLIAGPQCLVSTLTMPTGWWIIGRSPTRILREHDERPFLLDVGDRVRFKRIDRARLEALTAEAS